MHDNNNTNNSESVSESSSGFSMSESSSEKLKQLIPKCPTCGLYEEKGTECDGCRAKKPGYKVGGARGFSPFVKGVSGNPKGRPKRKATTDVMYDMLDAPNDSYPHLTNREVLVRVFLQLGCEGSVKHAKEILDRTDPKPKAIEIEHKNLDNEQFAKKMNAVLRHMNRSVVPPGYHKTTHDVDDVEE